MLSETVISTVLTASITGAGLIVAIYALISPITSKIFEKRIEMLRKKKEQFESMKQKLSAESSNKVFKQLETLATEIKDIRGFPTYLGAGVLAVFFGYFVASLTALAMLASPATQGDARESILLLAFTLSTCGFAIVGFYAIADVYSTMRKEFEQLSREQEDGIKESRRKIIEHLKKLEEESEKAASALDRKSK